MSTFVNDDGYLGTRLAQLANVVASEMPSDHSGVCVEACRRIRELEAAIKSARHQLVTLGGEADAEHGDAIQRAVLNEIDIALGEST